MIPLLVFHLHIVTMAAVFTRRWQDGGTGEGILGVFFMAVIFFVGWSMSSFILKLVMPLEGIALWLDRDAAALLLLTAAEGVFYLLFFRDARGGGDTPADDRGASRSATGGGS